MFQPIRKRNFPMWSCYLQDQEKWGIFVENLTNIIPAKVGSNWLSNFRDDRNVKRLWKDAKWWQKITWFFWSAELKKRRMSLLMMVLTDTIKHENVLIGYITHHINWINLLYNPKFLEKDWAAKNSKLFLSRYLGRKASVSKSPVAKPWYAISTRMKIFLFWKKKTRKFPSTLQSFVWFTLH